MSIYQKEITVKTRINNQGSYSFEKVIKTKEDVVNDLLISINNIKTITSEIHKKIDELFFSKANEMITRIEYIDLDQLIFQI